ncbi:peptide ABC transporter permease [Photobacterium phosphoreum]|uniref:AcfA family outer membrane beta-barrel protein n=1 Tax=Photobacterium phosphoreum TaxID=659 RepID=UPI0007F95FA9|nr:AcfA family outer membrane beta-barrel protein [Photobacterium phosphoreum]OBU43293.1 peptide ABC transporter permease [Photobacterium phosphoreum]
MNNKLLLPLALLCSPVFAGPYVGLEVGAASINHDFSTHFVADAKTVTPSNSSTTFGGFVGYRSNNIGIELGYKQFELEGSTSQHLPLVNNNSYTHEREWEADINVKQFIVKPVYFYALTEKVQLKAGAGITYTQYDYSSSSQDEYENILNDDLEFNKPRLGGESENNSEFGVIASIGIDYNVYRNINIGAAMEYYVDSTANGGNVTVNTTYFF